MWNDRVRFAERVSGDLESLTPEDREAARLAAKAIDDDPIAGAPLFDPFRGIWVHRLGPLRILYRLAPETGTVVVLRIDRVESR